MLVAIIVVMYTFSAILTAIVLHHCGVVPIGRRGQVHVVRVQCARGTHGETGR